MIKMPFSLQVAPGLSSPQSMILDLLESGDSRAIYLFQGARDLAELYNRNCLNNS